MSELPALAIIDACLAADRADLAPDFIRDGLTLDQAKAVLQQEAIAKPSIVEIMCAAAHLPERAEEFIARKMSLKQVVAALKELNPPMISADTPTH